ncbi:malate dehydrogenase [Sarocladium implicatum]|nr:malate dehydrogenase [Sarocladium implicatum]
MIAKSLVVLAAAALAVATPIKEGRRLHKRCGSTPKLPVNGDHQELPAPEAGLRLKGIALGYGIQNYTCASADATPVATGALAGLYDIQPFYPDQGDASLDQATFDGLTAAVIEAAADNIPLNLLPDLPDRVPKSVPGADAVSPFNTPFAPLPVPGLDIQLQPIGEHYFDSNGVPTFKLDSGLSIMCAKLDGFDAPDDSAAGPGGEGAVAWLRLGAKEGTEGNGTEGIKFVYRVNTGAGSSHGCKEGGKSDSSYYTAAYWFYG